MNGRLQNELLRGLSIVLGVLLVAGCAILPLGRMSAVHVKVGRPFCVVQSDKAMGWGQVTHAYLCRFPDCIALTYFTIGDADDGAGGRGIAAADWPAFSKDGGTTWAFGNPFTWGGKPPARQPSVAKGEEWLFNLGYFFGVVPLPDGRLVAQRWEVFESNDPGSMPSDLIWTRDGKTWSEPVSTVYHVPTNMHAICFSVGGVTNREGQALVVGYGKPAGLTRNVTMLFGADTTGTNFSLYSVVAEGADCPWGNEGACEPAVLALPDGDMICVTRTGCDKTGAPANGAPLLLSRSSDGGHTWAHSKMEMGGVMPKLLRMSSGVLILATGRPGNRLYFSNDDGRTWGREVWLSSADSLTSGYCDALEVAPDRLLVVYDLFDTDLNGIWLWEPEEVNGVMARFVDVRRPVKPSQPES